MKKEYLAPSTTCYHIAIEHGVLAASGLSPSKPASGLSNEIGYGGDSNGTQEVGAKAFQDKDPFLWTGWDEE